MELLKTRKNVYTIYFVSIACFIMILIASYLNIQKTHTEKAKLKEAITKLNKTQNILNDIQSIESGERGYVISGKESFLIDYNKALNNINSDTSFIRLNFFKSSLKERLILLIKEKVEFSNEIIKMRRIYGDDSTDAFVSKEKGLVLMNEIKNGINFLENEQIKLINDYSIINEDLVYKRKLNYFLLVIVLLFASGTTLYVFNKGFKTQIKREKDLKFNTALISNLYDPVITTDSQYNITSWNKNAADLFGYTEQEVMGKRLKDVLQTKTTNRSLEEIRNIIDEKTRWNGDVIYLSKYNKVIYANVSTSLVYDEKNENNGTVSIIRDTTAKTITENKLQELSENLELEIQQKVAEIKKVYERTTDAFVAFDNDLNYIFVNEKAASLHGSSVKEMTGKNIMEYTPQKSSPEFYNTLLDVLKDKKEIHCELRYDLTGQWFENWIYPDINGISIYYRDITKRKEEEVILLQTNKKLEELNNRFELIIKGTNDALWDWDLETNEIWGNDKYDELVKNKPKDKKRFEYFIERMHPEDSKNGMEILQRVFSEKKGIMFSEYRFLDSENNWKILYNRQSILYNKEGNPYRIVGVIQDITSQKKIQEQIIHEKEMSDVLINSLPGVFYMFNKEGKYIRWNKNLLTLSGYTDQDMINTVNPVNFVPDEQKQLFAEKIANVFKTGFDNVEGDLLDVDKKRIPYYFTGVYLKYNGEDCMMGVGIDISEKSKYQSELKELSIHIQKIREEERTRIAREIHDELGQQLTGLKMDISWINKKMINDKPDVIEKIKNALVLIDDTVKSVRRISTQLRPSVLDDLGLISAMEWQTDEFQKRFNIPSIFISNVAIVNLHADKITAIFRIYQESLTNILRHSEATKVITSITLENDKLLMKISDNGIGFNETEIKNKKTLGLLGMKERALMLGGHYQIISKPNEGTIVLLELPLDV